MKKFYSSALATLPFVLSSCIDKKINGDSVTYSTALWVTLALIFGGCALIFGSRFVPKRTDGWYRFSKRIRLTMIFVGAACLYISLAAVNDRVTISPSGFTETTGLIGMSRVHEVRFQDIQKIEITKEVSGIGRNQTTNYFMVCYEKNGGVKKVPASSQSMQSAFPDIVRALQASGIPVFNKTGEP
ncbi:MAG: hypothetical protein WCG66_06205 [bacterium]